MSGQLPPDRANAPGAPPRPGTDVGSTLAVSARVLVGAHATLDFPTLSVVTGRASRIKIRLDQPRVTFGRSPGNDVVLEDEAASRFHAEVTFADGAYVVTDLKSSNGVYVDGRKVERAPLKDGTKVLFGATELVFPSPPRPSLSPSGSSCSADGTCSASWARMTSRRSRAARPCAPTLETVVHRQDAQFESMLFVVAGDVRVVEINDEGGERTIGTLVRGDHFGERALLPVSPRRVR